jgi:membrane protease YdiL (CAAX protease family)
VLDSISKQRPAPVWLCSLLVGGWLAVYLPANYWFGPSRLWAPLKESTYGIVSPILIVSLLATFLLAGVVLVGIGKYRPSELGLETAKLADAVAYTAIVWVLLQFSAVAAALWIGQTPRVNQVWSGPDAGPLAGKLLGQLAGNALAEEIIFRGFLFVQLALWFSRRMPNRPQQSAIAAGMVSSVAFAIAHLPHRFGVGDGYANWSAAATDQGWLVVWGCLYCWMYARTGNLLFVVGVHALANAQTMLIDAPDFAQYVAIPQILAAVIVLLWHRLPHSSSAATLRRAVPRGQRYYS